MAKKKALKKKISKKNQLTEFIPSNEPILKDFKLTLEALRDCLKENDLDSIRDVLWCYLMASKIKQSTLAKKSKLNPKELDSLYSFNKDFNPRLSTLAAIIEALNSQSL